MCLRGKGVSTSVSGFFKSLSDTGLRTMFLLELTACVVHPVPFVPLPRWVSLFMFARLYLFLRYVRAVTPLSTDGRYVKSGKSGSGKKKGSATQSNSRLVWYFPSFFSVLRAVFGRMTIVVVMAAFLSVAYIARAAVDDVHTFTWWACVIFPVAGIFSSIVSATSFVLSEDAVAQKLKPFVDREDQRSREIHHAKTVKQEAEKELASMRKELEQARSQNIALSNEKKTLSSELSTVKNRLKAAQGDAERNHSKAHDLQATTAKLRDQLQKTAKQLVDVQARCDYLDTRASDVESRSKRTSAREAELESKMARVRGTTVQAEMERDEARMLASKLKQQLIEAEGRINTLQGQLKQQGKQSSSGKGGKKASVNTNTNHNSLVSYAGAAGANASSNGNSRLTDNEKEQLAALSAIIKEKEARISELEAQLDAAQSSDAAKSVAHKDSEINHLRKAVKDARHQGAAGAKAIAELRSLREELASMNNSDNKEDGQPTVVPEALVLENRDLKKRVRDLEEVKSALEKEKEDMRIAAKFTGAAAVQSLKKVQAQVVTLREELARVKAQRADDVEGQISADEAAALRIANAQFNTEVESLRSKLDDALAKIATLQETVAQEQKLRQQAEDAAASAAAAAAEIAAASAAADNAVPASPAPSESLTDDLDATMTSVASDLNQSNHKLEETVSLLAGRIHELSGIIEEHEKDTDALESHLRQAEEEAAALRDENEKLLTRVRTQQLDISGAGDTPESPLVVIHRQLKDITQELHKVASPAKVQGSSEQVVAPSPLVMDLEAVVKRIEDRTDSVCRQLETVTGFDTESGEYVSKLKEAQAQLDAETMKRSRLESEVVDSRNQVNELKRELGQAENDIASLRAQYEEEQSRTSVLKRDMSRFTESINSQKIVIERLQSEITALRSTADDHEAVKTHLPGLEHHVRSLESDRKRLAEQVETLQQEVATLRRASEEDGQVGMSNGTGAGLANTSTHSDDAHSVNGTSDIDTMVRQEVAQLPPPLRGLIPSNFARVGDTSSYQFGTMQVIVQPGPDGRVRVRVAGALLGLPQFVEQYGGIECSKMAHHAGKVPSARGPAGSPNARPMGRAPYGQAPMRMNGYGHM
eukprot:TRINITY_DN3768_c0_g1_i1.p1 TRINITY_DN3768_c0_g1~~TRINITY_DN3768_c0_g1_i1.p1  ORF type:complete len:1109 (-),score=338.77 TRINITY_DN3768_c0_g1_i1:41-3367(-)